jgi:predicted nucleotidyltransferase
METQGSQDFGACVQAWRERLARDKRAREAQAEHLRAVARACARRLVQEFGASRVYLFGSLLQADLVHSRSDIDLAVEGLEDRLYFKALREVWALLPPGVELDLVPLERAWPGLADRVRAEGVLIDAAA